MFAGLNILRSVFGAALGTEARLLVVNGHPDPRPGRFCAALCDSCAAGANVHGFETRRLAIGQVIHNYDDSAWDERDHAPEDEFARAVDLISWADQVFVAFPMWLGKPPAALRLLFDAYAHHQMRALPSPGGFVLKKAHLVVTASLPSLLYRSRGGRGEPLGEWANSLSGLNVVQATLIGSIDSISRTERLRWLAKIHAGGGR